MKCNRPFLLIINIKDLFYLIRVETIKNYFALLLLTYYQDEGLAGTLIEAMAAGTPVIARNWRFNKKIVKLGKTGVLIKNCASKTDQEELEKIAENPNMWNAMRITSLDEAHKYEPRKAIKPLMKRL